VDLSALRDERERRLGHHMLAHLRTEAYPVYRKPACLPRGQGTPLSYERNIERIRAAKSSVVNLADPQVAIAGSAAQIKERP
jgi:hypothetical protein